MATKATEDDDPPVLTDKELRMMGTLLGNSKRSKEWCIFHGAWAVEVGRLQADGFIKTDTLNRIKLTAKGKQVTQTLLRIGAIKDYSAS